MIKQVKKVEPEYDLKCYECHERTPVRVDGLCRKCRAKKEGKLKSESCTKEK